MSALKTIFLVAMDYEIKNLFTLNDFSKDSTSIFTTYTHTAQPIAIVETGVGKVNAAAAGEYALSLSGEKYINVGLAGSFDTRADIGSVYQITETGFWDVDVTAFDYEVGQIPGNGLTSYKLNTLESNFPQTNCISGDSFVSDANKVIPFAKKKLAQVLDMELAAIAHVFYLHQQLNRLSSYKAVSDYLNPNSTQSFYDESNDMFSVLKGIIDV